MTRAWNPVETRLLSEYLALRWPNNRHVQRVRVGSYDPAVDVEGLTPAEARALGVWRRWVDAVVWEPARIVLVEASVTPDPGHVAQLELYVRLWPRTPEYAEWAAWPVHGHLVYAMPDPVLPGMAAERGFTMEVFQPPWVRTYLEGLAARRYRGAAAP